MAETVWSLPRHEVNAVAYDPTGSTAVQTLVNSATGIVNLDDDFWMKAENASELLIELENAIAIMRRRCDYLCERDLAY